MEGNDAIPDDIDSENVVGLGAVIDQLVECPALVREIQEELSVQIQAEKLVYISEHDHQYETKKIHITLYKYDVQNLNYTLIDHDQAEWVSLIEIEKYQLAQADIPFLKKLV